MASETHRIEGKNVLITGGASGLGEALAYAASRASAKVIIADRDEQLGRQLEAALTAEGGRAKYIHVDVTSTTSQAQLIRAALAWLPAGESIDAAVLSAGIGGPEFDTTPASPADLDKPDALAAADSLGTAVHINLTGSLQCAQLLVKYGMGRATDVPAPGATDKSITLVGSLAGYGDLPDLTAYSASKWGVRGAFRSLRKAFSAAGVRVNLVAPGFVRTPLLSATSVAALEGAGTKFARKEDVVAAMMRAVGDGQCDGRALGVFSVGVVDIEDDPEGLNGSRVLGELAKRGALGAPPPPRR